MHQPSASLRTLASNASDLAAIARFVVALNAVPTGQCLHTPGGSAAQVRAALTDPENFPDGWWNWFFKAADADGNIAALVGCQPDGERVRGWLWGPWCAPEYSAAQTLAPLLETAVRLLPSSLRRVDTFLHVENRQALAFLRSAGFTLRAPTHIYTVLSPQAEQTPTRPTHAGTGASAAPHSKEGIRFLRAAHEVAFANLHEAAFPAASQSGQELLDGRDDQHVILGAADGLRLLGYASLSVNRTPREGFIDYLAVKPTARGRGVGRWLLQQALRWIFEEQLLPQASLCVMDWRDDAKRLYERAGFRLHATGIGAHRYLKR